ncbi:NAD(P)-dependent alcohol dehydrogenase [Imperialibacter roseus]|uniref:NAD(P)-dependent alcohol dehydrogenase n=1 Tax=Imperialibacter roseus TaxID=1324217 RepID=A0ABZ0IU24_9BACT|nr:NAD(P)-dependent alcohol dehydrogenase [Imperialibacter roseus]WOK07117.1 NAD(P)-dependent alcohol dehydrogenase [Imperialibacter roseus]
MKAMIYTQYGASDVLRLEDVGKPIPKDDEVLVKVHAASLNSWDWDRLTGKPRIYRLLSGMGKPTLPILGADVAGVVVETGTQITKFKPGDEVFGDLSAGKWGGFAEYTCAKEEELTIKPASMTFEEAAAIPQAGGMALQALTEKRTIKAGDSVLINGAGGGVGTFAIQIAKSLGAHITAVDLTEKHAMLQSLGASRVIDHTKEDFTKQDRQYDLIVDVIATRSISDYKRVLKPGGVYTMIGGHLGTIFQVGLLGGLVSTKEKRLSILIQQPNKPLGAFIKLFEEGKVKPIIDKVYPLEELPEAFQRIGNGSVKGKVVITPHAG